MEIVLQKTDTRNGTFYLYLSQMILSLTRHIAIPAKKSKQANTAY